MKKTKEMSVTCPQCGTELAIAIHEVAVDTDNTPAKLPKTALERIEALRNVGVDVSNLFAMRGANGGEFIASNKEGELTILSDDDPIFQYISRQGTVPNRRLFRRFVMAQMFRMLSYVPYGECKPVGVTEMIHRLGYEYQWKMLLNELHAQMKMEVRDAVNFKERNRWFNADVAEVMAQNYIILLEKYVDALPQKKCKRKPYKRIGGRDIFVEELYSRLFEPLDKALSCIKYAKNATQLYNAAKRFNDLRIRLSPGTPQCKEWVDAYKGSGAYFTMLNLIRFHGCVLSNDKGKRLDKDQSLAFLWAKAEMYRKGDGWRLLAMLKKMLDDNGIDPRKKMEEWRKSKKQ